MSFLTYVWIVFVGDALLWLYFIWIPKQYIFVVEMRVITTVIGIVCLAVLFGDIPVTPQR